MKKIQKKHTLKIKYMIGDGHGYTTTQKTISSNNPFLKIITNALRKLKIPKGSWGLQLKEESYYFNYKNKNISELEFDLLSLVSYYNIDEEQIVEFLKKHGFEDSKINHNYIKIFEGLLIKETEYSFLIYEEYKLK